MSYRYVHIFIQVTYPSGVKVEQGNVLTPTQVKDIPTVKWEAENNALYTLCMTGKCKFSIGKWFRENNKYSIGKYPTLNVVSSSLNVKAAQKIIDKYRNSGIC